MEPKDLASIVLDLGELKEHVFFVGASINILLVDKGARPNIRETNDIDAVAQVFKYTKLNEFEQALRTKGFKNSDKKSDPACR